MERDVYLLNMEGFCRMKGWEGFLRCPVVFFSQFLLVCQAVCVFPGFLAFSNTDNLL